jgi:hypothetical protein
MAGIGHNQPHVGINSLTEADRKKVKKAVMELNDSMTRAASERELQKEIVGTLYDELGLDKKLLKRLARTYFKANYNETIEENNTFEEFYDQIVKAP